MLAQIKIFLLLLLGINACTSTQNVATSQENPQTDFQEELTEKGGSTAEVPLSAPKLAIDRSDIYFPLLMEKRVALVVNQTSMSADKHLVDYLLSQNILVQKIFAPEHGFRGEADAGEKVKDGKDVQTGLPIISLYGKNKKPSKEQLANIDVVIFDIQDVGARFYTYISTMNYVMEACAENDIKFIVLDRPNPNGHYVDGPVLEEGYESFVGMNKIPVVHGMTVGEYAQMLNGEGMLSGGAKCDLTVVPCDNYDHTKHYDLPVRPSPNLPNMRSIYLYPSLCFFEGTNVSVGRGTDYPFQIIGHPKVSYGSFSFTPKPNFGAKYPKHDGKSCNGQDFLNIPMEDLQSMAKLNLEYIITYYKMLNYKEPYFLENKFFDKLAGTDKLRKQIEEGMSEEAIRATWQEDLAEFKAIRKKYLLYKDFE